MGGPRGPNSATEAEAMPNWYLEGLRDAQRQTGTPTAQLVKMRTYPDYWQGWHDGRPLALDRLDRPMLVDPTRSGGWCIVPIR